jgi:hypothetical protein
LGSLFLLFFAFGDNFDFIFDFDLTGIRVIASLFGVCVTASISFFNFFWEHGAEACSADTDYLEGGECSWWG